MSAMEGGLLRARIFPACGWAARKSGEVVPYVTWCAMAGLDPQGSGRIGYHDALRMIVTWRRIDAASARRILRQGETLGYWRISRGRAGRVLYLTSVSRLVERFGIQQELAPHFVPLALMRTRAEMSAHLFATVYPLPGHSGRLSSAPQSRFVKEQRTGVPATSQRRYDRRASQLVQEAVARVERDADDGFALVGGGYFTDRRGRQFRRLPDVRVPEGHVIASSHAAAHAMAKARKRRAGASTQHVPPVVNSRGSSSGGSSRPRRQFVAAATEVDARRKAYERATRDRDTVLAWGKRERRTFVLKEKSP